jgi:DNA polymerase-3 subunit delta'
MSFRHFPEHEPAVRLLQRSLERGRLGHAYVFAGRELAELEAVARTLAKTLACRQPVRGGNGVPIDCCDRCANCLKIEDGNHGDTHWMRPESKSRVITVDQMRDLLREIHLKAAEAGYKTAVLVAADRLNVQAANAFLKTLEEPPPKSVFVLLTTEPQRILDTVLSRCLRLNFGGEGPRVLTSSEAAWLGKFSDMAAAEATSLLNRYRLLDVLLQELNSMKAATEESLTGRSPLQRHGDAEKELVEKWEDELAAAIEAEYRRRRAEALTLLHRWLRDVWLHTIATQPGGGGGSGMGELLNFPAMDGAGKVGGRISAGQAVENLRIVEDTQRLLRSNVQEALALEVGLLKLHL